MENSFLYIREFTLFRVKRIKDLYNCCSCVFLSAERMKKINHKNPHRVGANFDRKKETSEDW